MNVSVLICTYGSHEWLRRGLRALDRTQGVTAAVARHDPEGTLASVRNAAAAAAAGDWLCFLDADDELAPGYLEAMELASDNAWDDDAHHHRFDEPKLLVPALQYMVAGRPSGAPAIPAWDRSLIDLNCAVIGTLVPRALFQAVGGFRELDAYEDWDLWLRCVRAGATLVAVPGAVYLAHSTPEGRNSAAHEDRVAAYTAIRAEHEPHFDWAGAYKQ